MIALTKTDLVDDTILRENEIRQQLQNSPLAEAAIVPVSAHQGTGLDELKAALTTAAKPCRRTWMMANRASRPIGCFHCRASEQSLRALHRRQPEAG